MDNSEYCKSLSVNVLPHYLQKNNFCEGIDSYILKWKTRDQKDYPEVEYNDLYNYLVFTTILYIQDEMKAYKSLQSYNFI